MAAGHPMDWYQEFLYRRASISQELEADALVRRSAATAWALMNCLGARCKRSSSSSYYPLECVQALLEAAQEPDAATVRALLGAGLDPGAADCALGYAFEAGDFQTLKLLLQLGAPPGQECSRALVAAASEGRLATVKALLEAGVPACSTAHISEWEGEDGDRVNVPYTALTAATKGGHVDVMRCLLAAGVDLEGRWSDVLQRHLPSALVKCSTAEAARVLLEAGAAVQNHAEGYFPINHHIHAKNEDVVTALLEAGADPNVTSCPARTALQDAASLGLPKAVASLLAAGANVNRNTLFTGSALHLTTSTEVALALLRAGADIRAVRNFDGQTPLVCAAASGSDGIVEALLAAGASVHDTDREGNTALHAVARIPYEFEKRGRIVELLCAAGADVNAVNNAGETPLAVAVHWSVEEVVVALIAAGATPTTEVLTKALRHKVAMGPLRGGWMTVLLPSHSISTKQLRLWAGAAFGQQRRAKQVMFWGVWSLRRHLPTELLRLIAAMRCMLEPRYYY